MPKGDGDQIAVPVTTPKFPSTLNPEHYLSERAWDCLGDPYVNIVTKIHLLAALMIACPWYIALLIGAQASLDDGVALKAAQTPQALDLVNQMKERHNILAKSERKASTRNES